MQNPIKRIIPLKFRRYDKTPKNEISTRIITCKTLDPSFRVLDVLVPIFYRPGRHFVWGVVLGLVSLIIAPVWWGLIFMFEVEDRVMKMPEID